LSSGGRGRGDVAIFRGRDWVNVRMNMHILIPWLLHRSGLCCRTRSGFVVCWE
jgi:hypothetical protein